MVPQKNLIKHCLLHFSMFLFRIDSKNDSVSYSDIIFDLIYSKTSTKSYEESSAVTKIAIGRPAEVRFVP